MIALAGDRSKVSLEEDAGTQAALLAIDNATGDIKAMVGGRDYEESKFNRATQALRQTGSSFKPYVYATAVDQPASRPTIPSSTRPSAFLPPAASTRRITTTASSKAPSTLRRAIADSRNIPALKLAERVGIHNVIDMAHKFGVTSTFSLTCRLRLGAAEITLNEQVAAYATFPNDGVRVTPRYITQGHRLRRPRARRELSRRERRHQPADRAHHGGIPARSRCFTAPPLPPAR